MKVIRFTEPKKALQFLKCLGVDRRSDLRVSNGCHEPVPSGSPYNCDRIKKHDIHISWWDTPSETRPVEIWGEGLTELHHVIARLL